MTGVDDVLNMAYRSVGWALVPQFLAKHVLSLTYKTGLCGPMPRQGTPQYQRAFRMTYAGVILVYLIGNIAYVVWSQDPNFYRLLNVNSTAEDAQVKTAFRRFAVRNHPDKVGEQGQELFMRVRHAYEALIVPAKKFAYERFGPVALTWENLITENEYLWHGLFHSFVFYGVSLVALGVHAYLGESGNFWQVVLFIYLFACEMVLYFQPFAIPYVMINPVRGGDDLDMASPNATIISYGRPAFPLPIMLLHRLFPGWLPYQIIKFSREFYVAVSLALVKVLPVLWPNEEPASSTNVRALWSLAQKVGMQISGLEAIATRSLQLQLSALQPAEVREAQLAGRGTGPFPDQETVDAIHSEVRKFATETQVTNHPMLAEMWRKAILAGRAAAAAVGQKLTIRKADKAIETTEEDDFKSDWTRTPISPTDTALRLSLSPPTSPRVGRAVSLPPVTPPSRSRPSPPRTMPLSSRRNSTAGDAVLRNRGSPVAAIRV